MKLPQSVGIDRFNIQISGKNFRRMPCPQQIGGTEDILRVPDLFGKAFADPMCLLNPKFCKVPVGLGTDHFVIMLFRSGMLDGDNGLHILLFYPV